MKYYLMKRFYHPYDPYGEINGGHGGYETTGSVETIEEAIVWAKENYEDRPYVIKGEIIEFNFDVDTVTTITVKVKD